MSESRDDGQPANGGASQGSGPQDSGPQNRGPQDRGTENRSQSRDGQPGSNGQPGGPAQGARSRSSARGSDPVADFQRWLMKAGARSMAAQVADQVKRTVGAERRPSGDVWDTATNEPPPDEPPECQWCPVCQAARAARTGNAAGLGARLADAGGVLATVVQDAFSAFDQFMKTQDQNHSSERSGMSLPRPAAPEADRGEAGQ